MARRILTLAAAALAGMTGLAAAHPHVFVDATFAFRFDAEGRLAAVETVWTYDEFYSLYAIEVLEMDQDGDGALTEEELEEMARLHTEAPEQEAFPSQIFLDTAEGRVPLALPSEATAALVDNKLVVRFARAVETPFVPAMLSARVYDPSYFIAYTIAGRPAGADMPEGCKLEMFRPDLNSLGGLQTELYALSMEETPSDPDVGRLFADEMRLSCG